MRTVGAVSVTAIRAVIYARRSQKHQDASVETQVEEAKRFIEKMGWQLGEIYRDDDKNTGRKEFKKRAGLLRLLADAEDGEFNAVVTRDHTRLGGDTARTMLAIEGLKEEGVAVWYYISGTEVRLDNWMEKTMFAIQNATSEGERDGISSRTYEALMVKARAGYNAGGSCFGYDNVPVLEGSVKKRTEYRINDEQADVVRKIFTSFAEGDGLRTIAKNLNREGIPSPQAGKRGTGSWSLSVIRPMLLRERYSGLLVYGRRKKTYKRGTKVRVLRPVDELVQVEVPALRIIGADLWEAVQERFRKNNRKPWQQTTGRKPRFMLSRLARCSVCGGPIHAKSANFGKSPMQLYVCGYFQDRAACTNSLRRPVSEIDTKCIDWIKANILREGVVLDILDEVRKRVVDQTKDSGAEVKQLEKQFTELKREVGNLAEAIAMTKGVVSALTEKLTERQDRLSTIEARLKLLKAAPDVFSLEVRRIEAGVRKRIDHLHELLGRDVEEARKVLESLLDGPMKFTPIETAEGARYEVTGRIATGDVLRVLSGPPGAQGKEADTARTKPYPQRGRPRRDSNPC